MNRCAVRFLFVMFGIATVVPAVWAQSTVRDQWLGVYMGDRKVGYSSLKTVPAVYHGKSSLRSDSKSVMRLEMLGTKVSQDVSTVSITTRAGSPIYQEFVIASNGSTMQIKATFTAKEVLCKINNGGSWSDKTISIPAGADLIADGTDASQPVSVKPGQKRTFYYFNPVTITLDRSDMSVEMSDKLDKGAHGSKLRKVSATTAYGTMVSWETTAGTMVKGEFALGPISMMMLPESRLSALDMSTKPKDPFAKSNSVVYTPPKDFAVATAVRTEKPIQDPRKAVHVELLIEGVPDKSLILSDKRQQAQPVEGKKGVVKFVIDSTESIDNSLTLPIQSASMEPYLKQTSFLEVNSPEVRKASKEATQGENNARKAIANLRTWVHNRMTPDASIGVPRGCLDVLKRSRGVCRDYAALFAGLARAAGIPTRVCGGIVYAEGRFYYHAWAECWVGDWLSVDPTLGDDIVDATHVKFAQGDVTDMFKVASIVGRLKITVIDSKGASLGGGSQ